MTVSAPLSDRIFLILDGLRQAVAARIAGGALAAAMIVAIWSRVKRTEVRILALLARFQAGRLRVRAIPARSGGGSGSGGTRVAAASRLPVRFGWLLPMVPQHAAGYGSQFRALLADPEMVALLAASQQARRVLAPLCRMLGLEAELLGPVPEGRKRASAPEKVKRVRKPRPKIDWGRIPLPRGVLTAARRQGFGKMPRD